MLAPIIISYKEYIQKHSVMDYTNNIHGKYKVYLIEKYLNIS